jgi:hypothetical protein
LHLAASTLEADVEAALTLLLADGKPISAEAVKAMVNTSARVDVPTLASPPVDLGAYDALIGKVGT